MFIAHLPAGYLLTRRIVPHRSPRLLALGLAASVLPDLDLVEFYAIDHRRVLHHAYWTHQPFWWGLLALLWLGAALLLRSRAWALSGVVLFANVFAHLALDTVAGHIRWLAPFSDTSFALVTVPPGHAWWVSNFVLHWTFLIELAITAWAGTELLQSRATKSRARTASATDRRAAERDRA
jgi:inner membrane protein